MKYILKQLAKLIIRHFKPQIIAVTGSVGKTSAKEAVYAVLKNYRRTRKSKGNLINKFSALLAIIDSSAGGLEKEELKPKKFFFQLKVFFYGLFRLFFLKKSAYPEILILEYAADRPGDIKEFLEIAKPFVGIMASVGGIPVHVEFFNGPDAIAKEKARIIEQLQSNGFAVLNFDDEIIMNMKERTRARIITFGFNEGADVKISGFENKIEDNRPFGISFKLEYRGSFVPVILKNVFGKAHAYASAAAACVGLIFDLNLVEISEALLTNYRPAKGRMNLLKGIKGSYIIDDSCSASPISMEEALKTFSNLPSKRKIAILGDMLELGKYSIEAHESIGLLAGKIADILITVGLRAKFIAGSAESSGLDKSKILIFDTINEAGKAVQDLIKKGDLILIKASKEIELEKIVEEIKEIAPIV